jgi:hypothetical protein
MIEGKDWSGIITYRDERIRILSVRRSLNSSTPSAVESLKSWLERKSKQRYEPMQQDQHSSSNYHLSRFRSRTIWGESAHLGEL